MQVKSQVTNLLLRWDSNPRYLKYSWIIQKNLIALVMDSNPVRELNMEAENNFSGLDNPNGILSPVSDFSSLLSLVEHMMRVESSEQFPLIQSSGIQTQLTSQVLILFNLLLICSVIYDNESRFTDSSRKICEVSIR